MAVHTPFLPRMDAVASWRLYHYTLPLSTFSDKREGLILQTTFADGACGWGEIAPLPERSKETLDEAKEQLLQALHGKLRSPPFPSVAFGLECALTPYKAPRVRFPLWALLAGTPKAIHEKAIRAELEGFRAIKIKVSNLSPSDAEQAIRPLIGKFQLRIDVNRAWSFDQAVEFFSQFPKSAIACIEEPTHELDRLHDFPFPFALDESLSEIPFSKIAAFPHLTTLIIKPTVTGGSYALKILEQLGKQIIFTGAFESGIGTAQIAIFAHRLNLMENPLGLDTYRFLKEDLLQSPLDFSQGTLQLPSQFNLNLQHLAEVAHG
ncbi:MAG: o-succinylbenzoate synthase [Verrucomicrobia bacterium]|nr:o-succinylbenzoate synthase [Verrucomicrobiota bacterium]